MKRTILLSTLLGLSLAACGDSNETTDGSSAVPDLGSSTDSSSTGDGAASGGCTAARAQLLGSIDSVSTGEVSVLETSDGVKTIFVDATAGGASVASTQPWIFVNLESATRVDVTDVSSVSSTAWDLALKRPILYTNSGDGGPGQGGAVLVQKELADVTAADAAAATFAPESFFDAGCEPKTDLTGAVETDLSGWYDYDQDTHVLSPAAGTWLVKGGTGKPYALQIAGYYALTDGGMGMSGGAYLLKVKAL